MTTVVNENDVTCFAVLHNPIKGFQDIFLGRLVMATIVHQNQHVLFFESLVLDQVFLDVQSIVMATTKLTLLSFVVDTNENRLLITINRGKRLVFVYK